MGAVVDPYRARLLLELKNGDAEKQLRSLAHHFTRSTDDARDLVQTALARVLDPLDAPWDPVATKSLVEHLGKVMSNLSANARRSGRARYEVLPPEPLDDDSATDGAPLADVILGDARDRARLLDALLAELDGHDPEGAAVLRAIVDGVEGHPAIAARVGIATERVRHAYDRIKYAARPLLARKQKEELKRTGQRRAPPAKRIMKEDPS